jgi:hypothetical protein
MGLPDPEVKLKIGVELPAQLESVKVEPQLLLYLDARREISARLFD